MLTTQAFNALLKTLEEPPAHAYFILATTEVHKVPDTILSRCQRFDFRRIENETIIERLRHIAKQEQIEVEEEALILLARTAEGGMRNAISLFEQITSNGKLTEKNVLEVLGITGFEAVSNLHAAIEKHDVESALKEIQSHHRDGQDLYQFNREFLNLLRQKLLASVDKKEPTQKILGWIELFQAASKDLKSTLIPQLPLEIAVIKSCMILEETKGGWLSGILSSGKETPKAVAPVTPSVTPVAPAPPMTPIASTPAPPPTSAVSPSTGLKQVPIETASAPSNYSSLTFEMLQKQFARVLESISTPSIRQSFKTGVIQEVSNGVVLIEFQSQFHLQKVDNAMGKSEIEAAFEKVFGQKVRLDCRITDVNQVVDATLDIFGGELVE